MLSSSSAVKLSMTAMNRLMRATASFSPPGPITLDRPGIIDITLPSGPSLRMFWNCSYMSRNVKSPVPSVNFLYSSGWSNILLSANTTATRQAEHAQ